MARDLLEQIVGGRLAQLSHSEVVDDEQRDTGQLGHLVFSGVGERGRDELFDEGVGVAVDTRWLCWMAAWPIRGRRGAAGVW